MEKKDICSYTYEELQEEDDKSSGSSAQKAVRGI